MAKFTFDEKYQSFDICIFYTFKDPFSDNILNGYEEHNFSCKENYIKYYVKMFIDNLINKGYKVYSYKIKRVFKKIYLEKDIDLKEGELFEIL